MYVSLSQRLNYPANNYISKERNRYCPNMITTRTPADRNSHPAFKAFVPTSATVLLIYKALKMVDGRMKLRKFQKDVMHSYELIMAEPEKYVKDLPELLKIWTNNIEIVKNELPYIRTEVLDCFNPYIADDNPYNRQIKKDIIRLIINSGDCSNGGKFLNTFETLPDDYYGGFKEEIADICLYSPKFQQAAVKDSDLYLYRQGIIKALDNNNHTEYLLNNKDRLIELKQQTYSVVMRDLRNCKNLAFEMYSYDTPDDKIYKLRYENFNDILLQTLINNNFDAEKTSEILNMDQWYAEDIIKDIVTDLLIKKSETDEQKLSLYKQRINEKMKITPLSVKEDNVSIDVIDTNIKKYIKKTGFKEELTEYKDRLCAAQETQKNDSCSFADDDTFLDYVRMHSGF